MGALILWTGAEGPLLKRMVEPVKSSLPGATFPMTCPLNGHLHQPPPGGVVLAMGTQALKVLQDHKLAPKGRTVTFMRERPLPYMGGWFLTSYDPYATLSDASLEELIQWDMALAARLCSTGSIKPQIGNYAWVDDFSAAKQYVEQEFARTGQPVPCSLDLETQGFFPWYPDKKIVTVQVTVKEGYADVCNVLDLTGPRLARVVEHVGWLLNSPMIRMRGANLKFDLTWLWAKWKLECTNFTADTTLIGSLLNENRSNSLETHAKLYTTMGGYDGEFNKTVDKGKMAEAMKKDPDGFLIYSGGDTDACLRASNVMIRKLSMDGELTRFYSKVLHPAARAFETIERRGVYVNPGKMQDLSARLEVEIAELEAQLLAMMPRRLRLKHLQNLSLTKPSLLKDFFFTPLGLNLTPRMFTEGSLDKFSKTKDRSVLEPSTSKDHLMMFSDVPESKAFVDLFTQWAQASKTKSTFVDGFLNHLRPDGLFHPTYFLFAGAEGAMDGGTNTGRLTAKDPPMQVLPKHTIFAPRIRACFEAPPGYDMWEVDVDQGELKIMADVSNEATMLEAYLDGQDLHAATGGLLGGYEYEEMMAMKLLGDEDHGGDPKNPAFKQFKGLRQKAKAANFGLIYDISEDGYIEYARKTYFVHLTPEEASEHFKLFFGRYTRIRPYHDEARDFARKYQFMRSPMGRVRHLPLINSRDFKSRSTAERQAINAPIQGCLSDMVAYAIAILANRYPDLWIAGMTHDAIYGYSPKDQTPMWVQRVVEVMSTLPLHELDWRPKVQFTASGEAGPTWGDMHTVHS